ncbi:MAG: CoA-binding protein [Candidatus Zixiibacteriota bacterium]|nr:MAG: CoA-binding protein [candidate division Zixibacteria bacterium]
MPVYPRAGGWKNPSPDEIYRILQNSKTIAVVGLSPDPDRPSNRIANYLQLQGYRVIPVNPGIAEALGEKSYPDLRAIPEPIDIVDIFRRPSAAPQITKAAVEIGARAVWMQEAVVSPEAFRLGEKAGLLMVMDRCMLKEHRRLFSGQ